MHRTVHTLMICEHDRVHTWMICDMAYHNDGMLVISFTLQISPYNFTSDTEIWLGPKHITDANDETTFSPCHSSSDTERQIGPNIEQHCKIHRHLPLQVHLE